MQHWVITHVSKSVRDYVFELLVSDVSITLGVAGWLACTSRLIRMSRAVSGDSNTTRWLPCFLKAKMVPKWCPMYCIRKSRPHLMWALPALYVCLFKSPLDPSITCSQCLVCPNLVLEHQPKLAAEAPVTNFILTSHHLTLIGSKSDLHHPPVPFMSPNKNRISLWIAHIPLHARHRRTKLYIH